MSQPVIYVIMNAATELCTLQWCPICFWCHKTLVAGHIKLSPGCFNWIEWCPAFHVGVISISSTWDATKWLAKCYIIGAYYFFTDFCVMLEHGDWIRILV